MTERRGDGTTDVFGGGLVRGVHALESTDDAEALYRLWADDDDERAVEGLGYVSPGIAADLLFAYLEDARAEVLDVGCGTGLTGEALADRGVTRIDGLDASEEMLKTSALRAIYRYLLLGDPTRTLDLDNGLYDAMIASSVFADGDVGPAPLRGLVRLLRPGGILAFTVRRDVWASRGFEAEIERLVHKGIIDVVEKRLDRFFAALEPTAWFVLCRKR